METKEALKMIELTWHHFYSNLTFDKKWLVNSKMHCHVPQQYELLVMQITTMVAGERVKEIRYPLDWWQAVKERWFPKLFLRRWPVQYHIWKIDFLYPELEMRGRSNPQIAIYDSQKSKGYPSFEDAPQEYEDLEEE